MWRIVRGERGFALPMALLLLGLGAILIPPMLVNVSSRVASARASNFDANKSYCTDSGVEDALWDLEYDDMASVVIPNEDDVTNYQITSPVNGSVVNLTVTNKGEVLAYDDFESGDWSGGDGWAAANWSPSGIVNVHNGESPYEGTYHVRIRSDSGYIERESNVIPLGQPGLRLQLWGKAKNFDPPDTGSLLISSDGVSWTEVHGWDFSDSDDTYRFVDVDLDAVPNFDTYNGLWVAVDADASNPGDKLFVDDIKIVSPPTYEIVVTCGDQTATATVTLDNGNLTILSWIKG